MDAIQQYVRTEDLEDKQAQRYCRDICLYGWGGCEGVKIIGEVKA